MTEIWKYVPNRIGIFRRGVFHPGAPVTTVILHPPVSASVHPGTAIRGDWTLAEIITPEGTRTYGFADGYITARLRTAVKLGPGQERDEVIAKWKDAPPSSRATLKMQDRRSHATVKYDYGDKGGNGGGRAHSMISRDDELLPTAEARRHVQTIRARDEFPEILAISMRTDGTNYQVKVPDPKNKRGYDLVDVLVHHNGLRSIKSASGSRITPEKASKIVTRYLSANR